MNVTELRPGNYFIDEDNLNNGNNLFFVWDATRMTMNKPWITRE